MSGTDAEGDGPHHVSVPPNTWVEVLPGVMIKSRAEWSLTVRVQPAEGTAAMFSVNGIDVLIDT
jgi:hypothetical protein